MVVDCVGADADELDTSLGKLRLELCEGSELGRADWSVIFWVREENGPLVANELMEVDRALSGFGVEVWSSVAKAERLDALLRCHFACCRDESSG